MKRLTCLIIEDEPIAAEILADYVAQVSFLKLEGICGDALFAMEALQQKKIDLIFLDIHLPKLKGLDFLRSLRHPPKVIITTAYHEYAVQGYELNVVDYLMKPIAFNRFLAAVNKVKAPTEPATPERFFVYKDKKKVAVNTKDIHFVEGLREYVRISCGDKTLTVKKSMHEIEEMLGKERFIRVHRSFIVAVDKIVSYTAAGVDVGNKHIPMGKKYRDEVMKWMEENE